MSDELANMFDRLRGQQPPEPFAFPAAIRRRGRQRTQHQVLAAGLAVVAVAGAGAGWAANFGPFDPPSPPAATQSTAPPSTPPAPSSPTSPAPSPTASATRTPAAIPTDLSALMLRAEDLGPGTWQRRQPYEPFEGDLWAWDRSTDCPAYRNADYPSLRQQVDLDTTGWAVGPTGIGVGEHVHRYRPGWAPRALDDVRRVVATCPGGTPPPSTPGGAVPDRLTVVDWDFAGDESLLIRDEAWAYKNETTIEPSVTLIAVVRVGDLVATVMFSPDREEQYARSVAAAAADRLAG